MAIRMRFTHRYRSIATARSKLGRIQYLVGVLGATRVMLKRLFCAIAPSQSTYIYIALNPVAYHSAAQSAAAICINLENVAVSVVLKDEKDHNFVLNPKWATLTLHQKKNACPFKSFLVGVHSFESCRFVSVAETENVFWVDSELCGVLKQQFTVVPLQVWKRSFRPTLAKNCPFGEGLWQDIWAPKD